MGVALKNRRGEIELALVDMCSKLVSQNRGDPYRRFMAAILEMAISDYFVESYAYTYTVSNSHHNRQLLIEDATLWFQSPHSSWLFSFENVCEVLDINADNFRKLLAQAKDEKTLRAEQCHV